MSNQRYAFHSPYYGPEADAQAIGDRIDELIDEKQEHVTGEELVAEARKRESPLRPCFTFDDVVAADKWRKKEARDLIKKLHNETNGEPTKTRAFEYVHHPEHGGKRVLLSHRSCTARPEFREQLQERELRSARRRLRTLAENLESNPLLRPFAKDIAALRKKIERGLRATV
ncbi:MAG TPA: hypothetical protein VKD00_06965 [Methyloceanibacter sp.]|nr:hypothetical protein [Methyloceanibacter sp.]